ncbi:MAG: J domain-containing protein [Thermomicrobium sp.]|nr:J domain-containing protein [Thermomicrobium sp.]
MYDGDPTIDYYQVLGVPLTATPEEIRRAYRQAIRSCHPDHVREPDRRRVAEERTKLLNAAYSVLSDPERRRAYDERLRQRAVADVLFQRYTGPGPWWARTTTRRSRVSLVQDLAAFVQLLAVTVIFVATLVLLLVASSLLSGLLPGAP